MMQRLGGGLLAGMMLAVAVSCGGTEPEGSTAGAPSTGAMAGTPGPTMPTMPSTPKAGMDAANGGTKATGSSGSSGSIGSAMSGVSSAAGAGAAGSTASATAGTGGASAAAAMTGSAGMSAAAGKDGAAAGMAGSTAAAGGGAASGGCGTESFKAVYDSIFANATHNCTGPVCHGREAAMAMTVGNLSMSSAAVAYMQLVKASSNSMACMGRTRVVPGDAAGSLLVQKLRGATTMCGGVMPVGADEIPEADLKRITDWINAGACDN